MSFNARAYPLPASTSAVRRPIPWLAPVITATRMVGSMFSSLACRLGMLFWPCRPREEASVHPDRLARDEGTRVARQEYNGISHIGGLTDASQRRQAGPRPG